MGGGPKVRARPIQRHHRAPCSQLLNRLSQTQKHGVVPIAGSVGLSWKRGSQLGELGEGGFELLDDLGGEYARGREGAGVVDACRHGAR